MRTGGATSHISHVRARWLGLLSAVVIAWLCPGSGQARAAEAEPETPESKADYRQPLPTTVLSRTSAARRIANLSPGQCSKELAARKISVRRIKSMGGIASPLRLGASIGEVRFITPGSKSIYGILDCRLVLALDELSKVLAAQDVVELHVDNFYRPRAHLPGKRSKRSQHAYGLAVDVHAFKMRDGRLLVVERDWQGNIGDPPCGENAQVMGTDPSPILLRNVVCALARAGIFHDILTPNYDAAHRNHLHLDIRRGADYYTMK